jgi:hypothetical protein
MSATAERFCSPGESRTTMRGLEKRNTADTARRFVAADMMPRGTGVILPRLAGIESELQWVSDDRSLVKLAKILVELGIGDPHDWAGCGKNPSKFLVTSVYRWIDSNGARQIRRRFDLHLTITDTILAYPDRDAAEDKLFLIIDPESAGYVVLKPSIELLESVHPRLSASLFHSLLGSINQWMRTYDYRDAEEHVELLREWARSDDNPDDCEFPDVEGCTPKSLKELTLGTYGVRKALTSTADPVIRRMLEAMLRVNAVSKRYKRPKMPEQIQEELNDCNPPLPCLLAVFSEHDAVEGCFDEESQTAYEMEPQPSLIIPMDIKNARSVKRAFDSLRGFCRTIAAAVALMDVMPGNENFVFQDGANECSSENGNQPNVSTETRHPAV